MQKLKNIFALFTLLVFLFPLVESEVHNFSHWSDFHCTVNNATHLHKAEHHCILCDFTTNFFAPPSFNHQGLALLNSSAINFFFSGDNYLLKQKDFSSLRAPPSLV
jgi:hypothetical protein